MRVLIVDDDEMTLELVSGILTRCGHDVDTAGDGKEALEILRRGQHRMVVSDWEMPQISGPELCAAIRTEDFGGYIYTILLTGRNKISDSVDGLNSGADDFLTKPLEPAQLVARVRIAERILSLQTCHLTIFALAKLAESRDPETGEHLERVRTYCRILAQCLATKAAAVGKPLEAGYANMIYVTSPLHDIGKVAIPDHVLLKPGRLSDAEFAIMKTHTTIGAQTLESAVHAHPEARFLRMARDIALSHHERWDGTGYPNHLVGEQIPLCGRVVALADVYDALTSKRVYKDAFTHDIAKAIIEQDRGTHFDPQVVEAFLETELAFTQVREKFRDSTMALAA
jgi:putative two-component system response regulator